MIVRRASLVVVLLFLVSVGTVSAECAWVLWSYISSSSSDKTSEERWRPLSSYATQAGCQEDQQTMRQRSSERSAAQASGSSRISASPAPSTRAG